MLLAVFLIFIIILVIFNELIIPSFSYRDARRLVRHQHEIAEHPEDESKDPLIELFPEPKQLGDKEEGKRIALIAPYGMHKRMAMRQRIMPIAISLLERGYFINIFIPCWDYALSYSEEQLHRDTGVLIFIRKRHWLPKVFDPILIWRLIRKVIAFQPDIIYCFKPIRYSGIVSIVTYFLRKFHLNRTLCKVKKIIIDEDEWEGFGGWADRIQNPYILRYLRDLQERIALRSCDSVIVGSEELKTRALAIRKGKNNVVVVPNGIMVELWPKRSSIIIPNKLSKRLSQFLHPEPLLLYTRFVEIKAEEIIKILSKVLISIPNAILLIVGTSFEPEGRYQRLKLMSLAKRENIEERIIQAGWIPFRDLHKYFSVAKVAICPYENTKLNRSRFPVKLIEIMAAGVAVVAYKVGEFNQVIINNSCGLLVPPGNDEKFAQEVVKIIKSKELRERLGNAANDRVHTEYGWNKLIINVEDTFKRE